MHLLGLGKLARSFALIAACGVSIAVARAEDMSYRQILVTA
jgi:hypothetical protein